MIEHEHSWQYLETDNRTEWHEDIYLCDCGKSKREHFTHDWSGEGTLCSKFTEEIIE